MTDTPALLASAPHQAARLETTVGPADTSRRRLESLRSMIATWDERIRVRWELEQMSASNPHLIDDIGLTRRQVEAEIAKPFWQA
ncbi:Uncharacterized conserved protein YjiS, DUF1127 family [Mesorhizobium albiziae]|uniref:Uncharacterized conserved protein YjiS, DUF1127 family n=1 Tax=Neomesorhizobium albiziae TaxID=335020 RepID=A0A1I4BSD4_9HYPH|nr:DUF1127 domain-containing protein [Mesorhizobium albiziae]GLS29723.1 hypothetical protein GCM10007937_14310 [Mesorhizobium albiziae]SFK70916.1 Uncharacterized conserved protein YjiS, DUF1127 family [Mesorhizobium albiziae]